MMMCDCYKFCKRLGKHADGSGGFFCPYVPIFPGSTEEQTECKGLTLPMEPTIL